MRLKTPSREIIEIFYTFQVEFAQSNLIISFNKILNVHLFYKLRVLTKAYQYQRLT